MTDSVIACVACRAGDQVRTVGAVLLDGRTQSLSRGAVVGVVGWTPAAGVYGERGWAVTETARLLAPPPLPPSRGTWYVWVAVLTVYCLCWTAFGLAALPGAMAEPGRSGAWVGVVVPAVFAVVGLIPLVIVVAGLVRRRRKDDVWRAVAPHVAWLHERAWYCGRCAGVFFLPGTVPGHVPTDALIPIASLRDTVWLLGHRQWWSGEPIADGRRSLSG